VKNKIAAMEMSIGTIVTIVLSMTLLIGGIMLVTNISKSGADIVDMTDSQVKNQINQLFGEDDKIIMYPDSREVKIQMGDYDAFAFGIKNLITGGSGQDAEFEYDVRVLDKGDCPDNARIENWIVLGKEGKVKIPQGDVYVNKVKLLIPEGSPLCGFRLAIDVKVNGNNYYSDSMDVIVKG